MEDVDISNKTVIVTGGCGFIGTNLVNQLLEKGAKVYVLDLPSAEWDRLPKSVTQLKANLLDKKSLKTIPADVEIVYHLAARTDLNGRKIEDYAVNYEGTENLIKQLKDTPTIKRFVFYSTQLVVGLFNETRFIDEEEPYRTNTVYGHSKILGEEKVRLFCDRLNIPYTIIRPTSVYGPWGESPYREFFSSIKNGQYVHIGKANNLVSLAYVKNLVDLTILLSVNDSAKDAVFYGTDFHPYTMREVVDTISTEYGVRIRTVPSFAMTFIAYSLLPLKKLGINVPIYPFRLKNLKANYCYDIQNSVSLGYLPKYDLKLGIKETVEWYENVK